MSGALEQKDFIAPNDDCADDDLVVFDAVFRVDFLLEIEARHVEEGDGLGRERR